MENYSGFKTRYSTTLAKTLSEHRVRNGRKQFVKSLSRAEFDTGRLVSKKTGFSALASKLNMWFDQQELI